MGEVFAVGDRIEWWSDIDGGLAEPGDPGAKKHTGTVASVHRNPNDDRQVVAYLVTSRSGVAGTYTTTVRPDLHRPTGGDVLDAPPRLTVVRPPGRVSYC